ncbi:hypothetical protein [Micromonospora globispora]|nr:hypothetical protein [Micromonospora globispora]
MRRVLPVTARAEQVRRQPDADTAAASRLSSEPLCTLVDMTA